MTEANEFWKVYKLDVVAIPTNRGLTRQSFADVIFRTDREKYQAILDELKEVHETGRPVLVGTTSIERSELISEMLKNVGIKHQVLNAKFHESEAEIVAQAGRKAMVTIATNMAGRGTDIILGGNAEFSAWADLKHVKDDDGHLLYPTRLEVPKETWESAVGKYEPTMKSEGREVAGLGGLHIIGTERHESRRIDNQLRGRSGRQGDPGSSRFFLSLEDDLMRKFAGEWVSNILARLGMEDGEAIESKMVSRRIEGAQKKVEERNFDSRKNLLEYDEVMDEQRKRVYSFRQRLLDGEPPKDAILDMIDTQIKEAADRFLADDYSAACFAEWAGQRLGVELNPGRTGGPTTRPPTSRPATRPRGKQGSQIRESMEENLPADADSTEYNWLALATWFNTRYGTTFKDRDLRKAAKFETMQAELDRGALEDFLTAKAEESIAAVDLTPAREFLANDWGVERWRAGPTTNSGSQSTRPPGAEPRRPRWSASSASKPANCTDRKEAEFPVRVGLTRYLAERSQGQSSPRYDRDGLAAWATERFGVYIDPEEIRAKFKPEIEEMLLTIAHRQYPGGRLATELDQRFVEVFGKPGTDHHPDPRAADDLAGWAQREFNAELTGEGLVAVGRQAARRRLLDALDARYRPEMREMEKVLLLQILDQSWMEHLRTMDHLRSSVGLRGYAQVDPKVEYKREGMKIFEEMWSGVSDKVTDLVFRMEQLDPDFLSYLGSRWQLDRAKAIHQAPEPEPSLVANSSGGGIRSQQEAAIAASQQPTEPQKREPVRNTGRKVGRNDPCPCGSGKKFKACCMNKEVGGHPF